MENKIAEYGKGYLPMTTSGGRELVVGKFTATELAHFNEILAKPKTMVQTPALKYVKKLIEKDRSAIVPIPDGGGKSAILEAISNVIWGDIPLTQEDEALFDGNEPGWLCIGDCSDADSLIKELWEWEGCPSPRFSEVWDKGRIGDFTRHRNGLTCFYCSRQCTLVRTELRGYVKYEDDDVVIGLQRQGGDCPVIKRKTLSNLPYLKENMAIEVPRYPSGEYLSILRALQKNRCLILLCSSEAEDSLRHAFPTLTVRRPPNTPINLFPQIYAQRLEDAGLTVSPLPPSSLTLLAIIGQRNPGRFLQLVGQLIDDIEMDGCEETVSNIYVSRHICDEISEYTAIEIIIGELRRSNISWVKAKRIRHMLLHHFNLETNMERVGRLMTDLGLRKRRNPDAEYYIGDHEVYNEVIGLLTEGVEGTEGGG